MNNELNNIILTKLDELNQNSKKAWLATLTEQSSVLLDTQDIAELFGYSYHYTYTDVISNPTFPVPIEINKIKRQKKSRRSHRKWLAGDVIKFIKARSNN